MAQGPITALVMHPVVREELLRPDHFERLGRICRLVSTEPLRTFEGVDALARVQVLITSWGSPRIDAAALDALPSLRGEPLVASVAGAGPRGEIRAHLCGLGFVELRDFVCAA